MTVSAYDPTEIPSPVIIILLGWRGEVTNPHELVVGGQMWSPRFALLSASYKLPATLGKEAMVSATDQPLPIL
jgi:hypothetical protein